MKNGLGILHEPRTSLMFQVLSSITSKSGPVSKDLIQSDEMSRRLHAQKKESLNQSKVVVRVLYIPDLVVSFGP